MRSGAVSSLLTSPSNFRYKGGGKRLLWQYRGDGKAILVWKVAEHKEVSRVLAKIEDSYRQIATHNGAVDETHEVVPEVLVANLTPLKVRPAQPAYFPHAF
jgi:hypothetical protein